MIVTESKPFEEILHSLHGLDKVFLVGCGECATTCKTGGKEQVEAMRKALENAGKQVVGSCIPNAVCLATSLKSELAKELKSLREAQAVVVLACGLGVQSVKENDRLGLAVLPACNSVFASVMNGQGNFYERCSLCGACVLELTGAICPMTLCAKSLLNGPCGGSHHGKCEVDKEKDCAWVLIYKELEKRNQVYKLKAIQGPRDYKRMARPHKLVVHKA